MNIQVVEKIFVHLTTFHSQGTFCVGAGNHLFHTFFVMLTHNAGISAPQATMLTDKWSVGTFGPQVILEVLS